MKNEPYREGIERGYPLLIEAGKELRQQEIRFHDLTMLFANHDEQLCIDSCCHLNERGYGALSRITSQSWRSDLRQIWSRTIEQNRTRSRAYIEDFAIEERPKMV